MKTMPISKFMAHALRIVDAISKTKEPVVITRREKPLAEVIPYTSDAGSAKPGKLAGTRVFEKGIIVCRNTGMFGPSGNSSPTGH